MPQAVDSEGRIGSWGLKGASMHKDEPLKGLDSPVSGDAFGDKELVASQGDGSGGNSGVVLPLMPPADADETVKLDLRPSAVNPPEGTAD